MSAHLSFRFFAGVFVCFALVSVAAVLRFDDLVARVSGSTDSVGSSGIVFTVLLLRLVAGSGSGSIVTVRLVALLLLVTRGSSTAIHVSLTYRGLAFGVNSPCRLDLRILLAVIRRPKSGCSVAR